MQTTEQISQDTAQTNHLHTAPGAPALTPEPPQSPSDFVKSVLNSMYYIMTSASTLREHTVLMPPESFDTAELMDYAKRCQTARQYETCCIELYQSVSQIDASNPSAQDVVHLVNQHNRMVNEYNLHYYPNVEKH